MFGTRTRTVVTDAPVTTTKRTPLWSPAQLIGLAVGIASVVFGAFAISKTGLDLDHVARPHDSLWGFHHTPFLALVEIGFGTAVVLASLRVVAGRALMSLLGAAALGLGVVVVADFWHHRLHDWLGVHDRNGWLFAAAGVVLLLASLLLPVFGGGTHTVIREERVLDDSTTPTTPDDTDDT
jgi:hypothetical protein